MFAAAESPSPPFTAPFRPLTHSRFPLSPLSLSPLSLCARAPGEGSMTAFLLRPLWSGRSPGGSGGSVVAVRCVLCRGGRAPLRTAQTPFQSCAPRWAGRSGTELSAPPESEDGVGGLRQRKRRWRKRGRWRGQGEVRKLSVGGGGGFTHYTFIYSFWLWREKN